MKSLFHLKNRVKNGLTAHRILPCCIKAIKILPIIYSSVSHHCKREREFIMIISKTLMQLSKYDIGLIHICNNITHVIENTKLSNIIRLHRSLMKH